MKSRVAISPNAYDDIVGELTAHDYHEIILETPPSHVSHWLHVDLAERVAHLGYPLTTVMASQLALWSHEHPSMVGGEPTDARLSPSVILRRS